MAALRSIGLDDAAISDLGLGLREPYVRSDGTVVTSVLAYPLATRSGRMRFGCVNLPGVTMNPEHAAGWSPGDAATVRRGTGDQAVLVAAGPLVAWRLGLAAARMGLCVTALASSHPDEVPEEWTTGRIWAGWRRILVLDDVPAAVCEAVATAARRPVEIARIQPPRPSGDETRDLDDEWLTDLLDGVGRVQGVDAVGDVVGDDAVGDFAAEPIALHRGWSGGGCIEDKASPLPTSVAPAGSGMRDVEEWRVSWRIATAAPPFRVMQSSAHCTADAARLAAMAVVDDAVGGEVRIGRVAIGGQSIEVYTSAAALDAWDVGRGELPSAVDGRWLAAARRTASGLRLYCAFHDLLVEAASLGLLRRRECRDLRATIRSALLTDL